MTHIAVALFFAAALLASLVLIHLTIRQHWLEILLALKGELGREVRPARPHQGTASALPRRAAA